MTKTISRRDIMILGAATGLLGLTPFASHAASKARIVIIGGGFGGATAARTLKQLLPDTQVTLVEPNPVFTACPFSNLVIGGLRDIEEQEFGYEGIQKLGVQIVAQTAEGVDPQSRTVTLSDDSTLAYDRLILSPGISFRWNALEGYDESAPERLPHAWKAGQQTLLLRDQLQAMEDGGVVVMTIPPAPFRCPPGPYERASVIANYLKTEKPTSKLIMLDSNARFSKMPLFQEAWAEHYPDHLEWRSPSEDGRVSRVSASELTAYTDFEDIKADVMNVIPPQKAGTIAEVAGVTDATGWCPINATTFESTLQQSIHVIGDATIASPMPKSAFSANLQGKLCAYTVASLISDQPVSPTTLANTCYSFITPETAISVVGVYRNDDGQFSNVDGAGGISPLAASATIREQEAREARSWFKTITNEAFG
ncbi:MAG: cytochrome C [Ponticaulis sp.]|nr:cytochrome C [Ponticaulis sp.]